MTIQPWKTENSDIVLRDQWIQVRADDCRTAEGHRVSPYYVLEYPDWVHMVVFDRRDRMCITRLYRHGNGEISTEIPAGTMDDHERDPIETGARELLEETGCRAVNWTCIASWTPNSATHNNTVHCLVASGAEAVQAPLQEPGEYIEHSFEDIDRVLGWIDNGRFRQALHIAAIFAALRYRDRRGHR